jgi:hypothetical protein
MRQVRITYADGFTESIGLKETAFGVEGTSLHGPVKRATFGEWVDESDGSRFPSHNKLSRSVEIPPTMRSGVPVYGTGRDR